MSHLLIDTHVHLWNPQRLRYGWLDDLPTLNRPYVSADYTAACAASPVDKLVFVQCDCLAEQNLEEVAFVNELAATDSRIAAIVAYAPLHRGRAVRDDLATLAALPRVRGVRRLLQTEADNAFCLRPEFLEGVAQLADFNLTFDICIKHPQLKACVEMVRQTPQVQFILDHIAKPDIQAQTFDPWRAEIASMAELPNVVCKLSGLVTEADHQAWTPTDLTPYLEHVVQCFGPERVMFGSDWPVVTLAGGFQRWFDVLQEVVGRWPAADQRALFEENARRVYRISA